MFKKILLCLVIINTYARTVAERLADHITKEMKTTTVLIELIKNSSRFRSTESIDMAKFIINAGADINEKDFNGMTALMHASILGNENLVQLLLNKNADINIEDNNGMTALMYASKNNHITIINLLFDKLI